MSTTQTNESVESEHPLTSLSLHVISASSDSINQPPENTSLPLSNASRLSSISSAKKHLLKYVCALAHEQRVEEPPQQKTLSPKALELLANSLYDISEYVLNDAMQSADKNHDKMVHSKDIVGSLEHLLRPTSSSSSSKWPPSNHSTKIDTTREKMGSSEKLTSPTLTVKVESAHKPMPASAPSLDSSLSVAASSSSSSSSLSSSSSTSSLDGTKRRSRTSSSCDHASALHQEYALVAQESVRVLKNILSTSTGWKNLGERNGVVGSKRKMPNGFDCMRSRIELPVKASIIKDILMEVASYERWDPILKESKVVQRMDERTLIIHLKFLAARCWLSAARDFCLLLKSYEYTNGAYLIIARSVFHPDCPPDPDYVRGTVHASGYLVTPAEGDQKSIVIYISHADLGGIPSLVQNLVTETQVFQLCLFREYLMERRVPKQRIATHYVTQSPKSPTQQKR